MSEEEEEMLTSLLAKALKNPRQFLDNIPLCHTEMETRVVNDKGKTKSFYKIDDKDIPDIIKEEYKKRIVCKISTFRRSFPPKFYWIFGKGTIY